MNYWKSLLPTAATLLFAAQALAQTDQEKIEIERSHSVVVQEIEQRNAEVERRMYDAERQMAEAARQIAILSDERLVQLRGIEERFQFISHDRPRLGVTIGGDEEGPVKGVEILGVSPGSAADEAGLRGGDLITSVNGETLGAPSTGEATARLLDFMQSVELGDTLDLGYIRDGKTGEVQVEPALVEAQVFAFMGDGSGLVAPSAPNIHVIPGVPNAHRQMVFQWRSDGWGDMELVELSAGLGQYFGTDQGLLVVSAPESSSLQLVDGDVIQKIDGREPTSVRHALRILGSYQAGESLKLEIMRDKKRRTLDVEIPDDLSSGLVPHAAPVAQPASVPTPPRPAAPLAPVERT
jgi:C-terminal processing protease CtpA/Prc